MSNDKIITCSLDFEGFFIDFDIAKNLSLEWTRGSHTHSSDFVFAVGEIWLRKKDSRYLIAPSDYPGNLIEELKEISKQLIDPISVPNLENFISRGGWCAWMHGYWDRLNHDLNTEEDEKIYDLLTPLSIMESRKGYIAAYKYHGEPTIEVATRNNEGAAPIIAWSAFAPEKISLEVDNLWKTIAKKILS